MKIEKVSITYGELRSNGYPSFSNKKYEITLSAQLTEGETAEDVKRILTDKAIEKVKEFFGETKESNDVLLLPF